MYRGIYNGSINSQVIFALNNKMTPVDFCTLHFYHSMIMSVRAGVFCNIRNMCLKQKNNIFPNWFKIYFYRCRIEFLNSFYGNNEYVWLFQTVCSTLYSIFATDMKYVIKYTKTFIQFFLNFNSVGSVFNLFIPVYN